MQNQFQFLHPKVGARIFFSRILPLGCDRHSARCLSFSDGLDILQLTGLFALERFSGRAVYSSISAPSKIDLESKRA